MDDIGIAFWATLAATGPVVGLALVLEARWVQTQWTVNSPLWLRVPWALIYVAVAVGVTIVTGVALSALATGSDSDRTFCSTVLAAGLGLVMLTPVVGVLFDAFKRPTA